MIKTVSTLIVLALLSSCATRYHQAGLIGGGYSDFRVSQDTFVVNFKGNSFTSSQEVMKFALMRASELAIKNNYKYFTIQNMQDITKKSLNLKSTEDSNCIASVFLNNGSFNESSSTTTTISEIVKPGLEFSIKCYTTKPLDGQVINAEEYLVYNPIKK